MLKDIVKNFDLEEECKFCKLSDEGCEGKAVSYPGGSPQFPPCEEYPKDYYLEKLFDIDKFFDISLNKDGICICALCKNEEECRKYINSLEKEDIKKAKLPCEGKVLNPEWFEEGVFEAIKDVVGVNDKVSASFEIIKEWSEDNK